MEAENKQGSIEALLEEASSAIGPSNLEVHQLDKDCYPPTDSDDDSFIVLESNGAPVPTSSIELLCLNRLEEALDATAEHPNHFANDFSLCSSTTTINTREKSSLMEEINRLSEMLEQNKLKMKEESERLLEYKDVIDRINEANKQKFADTKFYIMKLQEENKSLRAIVKNKYAKTSDPQIDIIEQHHEEIKLLKEQNEHYEGEVAQLRNDHLQALRELKNVTEENALGFLNNAKDKEIEVLNNELTAAKETIRSLQMESSADNATLISLSHENSEMKFKLEKYTKALGEKEQQNQLVTTENTNFKRLINEMKIEMERLRKNLKDREGDTPQQEDWAEEKKKLMLQLTNAQATITDLTQKKANVEKEAEANRQMIKKLEDDMRKALEKADDMVAAEEQLKIYENDFESMQESRRHLVDEMEKLSNTLEATQKSNVDLLEEIERLKRNGGHNESANGSTEQLTSPLIYNCPICNKGFRTMGDVDQHIEFCINNDFNN